MGFASCQEFLLFLPKSDPLLVLGSIAAEPGAGGYGMLIVPVNSFSFWFGIKTES